MRADPDSNYDCHSNATLSLGTRRGVAMVTPVHAGTIRFSSSTTNRWLGLGLSCVASSRNCCCAHTSRVVRYRLSPIKMNPIYTATPPPRQQKQHQQQRLDGIGGVVAKRRAGVVQAGWPSGLVRRLSSPCLVILASWHGGVHRNRQALRGGKLQPAGLSSVQV